jgi:1-aminocyclopropane-1-carboxylate deaminase/D-cysteine desulfhydrase-like pyridoxal-dependent ACC family enzyme
VLAGPAREATGNLLLDRILGAEIEIVDAPRYYDVEAAIAAAGERLRAAGREPYVIPVGGASPPGVLAYLDAARELVAQAEAMREHIDWVVVADGSGGTHAGLLAGLPGSVRVLGVDVGTRPDLDTAVPRLAATVPGREIAPGSVIVDHDHAGASYGAPTPGALAAIRTAARTEGLLLDPVYTGKALAALVTRARDGRIRAGDTVVFLHTGGAPVLFAEPYRTLLDG